MSAYLNLTVEKFFEESKERIIMDKIRIAQKQKILPPSKRQAITLWHTYFLVTCIDFPQGVILRCTVPLTTTMSDPWSKDCGFQDDKKHYTERHDKVLKAIEDVAAKYYPAFGDKDGKLKEGEWSWGE